MVQSDGSIVYAGGLGTKACRMHAGEEGEIVVDDYEEPQTEFDLTFSKHAANAGGHGILRFPYPATGALVITATGDTITRVGTEAEVYGADRAVYFLNEVAGQIMLRGYAPISGKTVYLIRPGDQQVSTIPEAADSGRELIQDGHLFPNPYSSDTRLRFNALGATELEVGLYDVTGRHILPLHRGQIGAGQQELPIRLPDLPAGVYQVRLSSGRQQLSLPLSVH